MSYPYGTYATWFTVCASTMALAAHSVELSPAIPAAFREVSPPRCKLAGFFYADAAVGRFWFVAVAIGASATAVLNAPMLHAERACMRPDGAISKPAEGDLRTLIGPADIASAAKT